jgi:hypothetical protein
MSLKYEFDYLTQINFDSSNWSLNSSSKYELKIWSYNLRNIIYSIFYLNLFY